MYGRGGGGAGAGRRNAVDKPPGPVSQKDRGELVLELHNLLQRVGHHRHLFERIDMANLFEDLRDLEGDHLSVHQKLHTIGRIYRTQPILGLSARAGGWAPLGVGRE